MPSRENVDLQHAIDVQLADRSYRIQIGRDLLASLPSFVAAKFERVGHVVLIHDQGVDSFADSARDSLLQAGWRVSRIPIPSGEASKSVDSISSVWQKMLEEKTDRGSLVVAMGGGVVGDLAGFAAASFARGIPLIQIPTTLLSQVDSSVGGKTGINLPGAKNIVGAFWQPSLVVIDLDTLKTLPQREFVSGLAEVAKYGVILLPELFDYLEQFAEQAVSKDPEVLLHIVAESCRAKAMVVQEDERETSGRRAILNYGHTFAHAIESVTGYGTWLHGEAVAIGMHMAATLAEQLGRIDQATVNRQESLLNSLKLPTRMPAIDPRNLWDVMQHDKKVQHGKLRFILPSKIGHVELVDGVPESQVTDAIRACTA